MQLMSRLTARSATRSVLTIAAEGHLGSTGHGRSAACRDPPRSVAAPLRHGDRRRGARALAQHRFPARLPAPHPAASPGSQADHHERDHQTRSVSASASAARRSSRSPAARIRLRSATGRRKGTRSCSTRSRTPSRSCSPSVTVTCSRSSRGSGRSGDAAELLTGRLGAEVEVLPLYSRLAAAEQQKVFGRKKSRQPRRVVLATNVAETSLTVPGRARLRGRYKSRADLALQHALKVQHGPVEPISRASADQRKGRCGRVADGSAFSSIRRRTSTRGRSSPTRRCCARISRA